MKKMLYFVPFFVIIYPTLILCAAY